MAISGDYAVVGSSNAEAAYVFHRSGDCWTEQAGLSPPTGGAFGTAVAISGDYILVGASWHSEGGNETGAAYVFHRNGDSWTQQARLTASTPSSFAYFGGQLP